MSWACSDVVETDTCEVDAKAGAVVLERTSISALKMVQATSLGSQLVVDWTVSANGVPQLAYQIDVFSEAEGRGELLMSTKEALPHTYVRRLDLPKPAGSVRLTLHDIFDQPAAFAVKLGQHCTGISFSSVWRGVWMRGGQPCHCRHGLKNGQMEQFIADSAG